MLKLILTFRKVHELYSFLFSPAVRLANVVHGATKGIQTFVDMEY